MRLWGMLLPGREQEFDIGRKVSMYAKCGTNNRERKSVGVVSTVAVGYCHYSGWRIERAACEGCGMRHANAQWWRYPRYERRVGTMMGSCVVPRIAP